jgi:hypothetical protein
LQLTVNQRYRSMALTVGLDCCFLFGVAKFST